MASNKKEKSTKAKKSPSKKNSSKPKKDLAKKNSVKKTDVKKQQPKKAVAKKDDVKKANTKKVDAKKQQPKKVNSKKDDVKKAKPKKTDAKKVDAKKQQLKKDSVKKDDVKKQQLKKANAKKLNKNAKSNKTKPKTQKNKAVDNPNQKYVIINNKKIKLPKRIELSSYSCIWRIYSLIDLKTNKEYKKRFWIVIGDGHKRYRKFETQEEAIHYFRNLRKYAKMRVQSVNSKEFIRTVYTFFEMIWRGNDLSEINQRKPKNNVKNNFEVKDFEDEFTKYDSNEVDNVDFNEDEINEILAKNEKDLILDEKEETPNNKNYYNNDYESNNQWDKQFVTDIIEIDEKKKKESKQKFFTLGEPKNNLNINNETKSMTPLKTNEEKEDLLKDIKNVDDHLNDELNRKEESPEDFLPIYSTENTFDQDIKEENTNEIANTSEEVIDPYAITYEYRFEDDDKYVTDETILESKSLYELAYENEEETKENNTDIVENIEENNNSNNNVENNVVPTNETAKIEFEKKFVGVPNQSTNSIENNSQENSRNYDPKDPEDEEIELTQYQTSLNSIPTIDSHLHDGKYYKKRRIISWILGVSALLICLVAIVVIALLVVNGVI